MSPKNISARNLDNYLPDSPDNPGNPDGPTTPGVPTKNKE